MDDATNWLQVLVRGDVTDWERKFCASLIRQRNAGRMLSPKQAATLAGIRNSFIARNMRDEPVIEAGHDAR